MQRLRLAMGCETQTEFAKKYGFTTTQWNNYESGSPVGRLAARQLVSRIDGLSIGWIEEGKTGDLSLAMARKLGEA
jgi:transcriptional regulator with XRE-family HTH domain